MQLFVLIEELFKGRHFDEQIIILCIAWYWYMSFKLSLRDLVIAYGIWRSELWNAALAA